MARTHIVKQGECLSSIAKHDKFADWRLLYNHPQNVAFKRDRPNPNLICPGDKLFIPDKECKEVRGETDLRHKFRLKGQKTFLRIMLCDEDGEPFAEKLYRLQIERTIYEGTTAEDGMVEQEIPADAEQGKLTLWFDEAFSGEGYTWSLQIGHMDPVEELTGKQARLNNLGFDCGVVDGINGPKTQRAVRAFQEAYGLKVDGVAGSQTQAKLQEVHGC